MKTEELRALADSREALADACGGSNWSGRLCEDADDAAFVTANNPLATLASCQRDRLLADYIEWLETADFYDHHLMRSHSAKQAEMLVRFAALEAP